MTFLLIFIQDCLSYRVSLLGIEGGEGILKKKTDNLVYKASTMAGIQEKEYSD